MNNNISILVADDHPLLLKGLINELTEQNYNVLEGAENGAKALEIIVSHEPDLAILDISMPLLTGFEVIKKCKEANLNTKFIILTSYKEKGFIMKAQKLNISGYLLKDEPFSEVKRCITAVLKGDHYFSKHFDDILENEISPELKRIKFLSPSERTIIRLISQEKTSKEIAEQLSISYRTVQKHRTNIIGKLDLSSDTDALSKWVLDNKDLILSI
ncbi:MAG: response regulator transcription factor [Winogradskyella sp.]|nr:response regulator transcription factor [Winogradskyella sp.]NNK39089.1 response regulator transcription factor [Winogradskyella sp.]